VGSTESTIAGRLPRRPYRGADAYFTKNGLMWAQVTTYDHAQIKAK
jgi:hypothetical protein